MKKLLQISLALATAFGGVAAQAQDVKAGEKKIAMCIGCHGIPGYQASFPEIHKVPMIAGQNAKYIVSALQAYAKGDRKHPTMRGIAGSLTDQDMADVAAFYEQQAKLPAVPEAIPEAPANVAELLKKGACISCHGANFSKPIDPSYPKLAGQHADYLAVALKSYKTEGNANVGRGNAIMAGQVKQFSNAELKAIAAYVGSLPTELATVPQSKFR
ncbi:c-type cytochrome [Roseateles sp. BYS78W]|uniref:C-type cytochrome n=1 Tax=Pelomonas candidula TaxID=3299025 RepID=A0ABW7HBP4_9BURK